MFIYSFISGCPGSLLLHLGFLQFQKAKQGLLSSCEWASHGGGFSCGARAPGVRASVVMVHQVHCSEAAESSQTRDRTHVLYIDRWILIHCTTGEVPNLFLQYFYNSEKTIFLQSNEETYIP